ncbi:uncharacterized protein LOC108135214 [Drosophila elegans]|uniref:uncharacterized protein LOC108135214 n=1 Tax=Drosophila elegans TaxID=30023 RepID=UPI0007E7770F|nr:uncharacterized protein LOC108135214 [Drosophila elegans]
MDIDYSTYAQVLGFPYMPTPEEYYPEMRGGMQQQQQQQQQYNDIDQGSSHSAPIRNRFHQSHQGAMEVSDGFQANAYSPVRYQSTSAAAYRGMVKEQRRAKEMMSRNGL